MTQLRIKGWTDDQIGRWIGDAGRTVEGYYGAQDPAVIGQMAADMEALRTEARPRLRAVD